MAAAAGHACETAGGTFAFPLPHTNEFSPETAMLVRIPAASRFHRARIGENTSAGSAAGASYTSLPSTLPSPPSGDAAAAPRCAALRTRMGTPAEAEPGTCA